MTQKKTQDDPAAKAAAKAEAVAIQRAVETAWNGYYNAGPKRAARVAAKLGLKLIPTLTADIGPEKLAEFAGGKEPAERFLAAVTEAANAYDPGEPEGDSNGTG